MKILPVVVISRTVLTRVVGYIIKQSLIGYFLSGIKIKADFTKWDQMFF